VLTFHKDLAERMRTLAGALPPPPAQLSDWGAAYRTEYYRLSAGFKTGVYSPRSIGELCLQHPQMHRYGLTDEQAVTILAALDHLDEERDHRRAMAAIYRTELAGSDARLMDEAPGALPWRFNILIPGGRRDSVAQALRSAGHDASPWYPVVAPFFVDAPDYADRWSDAARIENEILNLWVDRSVNESRIRSACAVIRSELSGAGA
jgi:hypothetical protein